MKGKEITLKDQLILTTEEIYKTLMEMDKVEKEQTAKSKSTTIKRVRNGQKLKYMRWTRVTVRIIYFQRVFLNA